jgi:spermidine/putrescine transport system substrate-binding protein
MAYGSELSRRGFLRLAAGAAVAGAAGASLLSACVPETPPPRAGSFALARRDRPVTFPLVGEPIDDGLPVEAGATLRILGWSLYVKPALLRRFEEANDVQVEWTDFDSMDEAIARIRTGQDRFDLFFPTVDVLGKLVAAGYLAPLNLTYLRNRRNLWDLLKDPFYDRGSRYTVPYFVWTTGISWRNDVIPDSRVRGFDNPYEVFWQEDLRGRVHLLNGSREAIAMTLVKNGHLDVNTGDEAQIAQARDDLLDLNDMVDTGYDHEDYRDMWRGTVLHQSWSGNIGFSRYYAPDPAAAGNLSYWWPASGGSGTPGIIGNDTMAVLAGGRAPVAAHRLIDFLLSPEVAVENVTYEGYQQPLVTMEPNVLIERGAVQPSQHDVIVREADFAEGLQILELPPSAEQLWQYAYSLVDPQRGASA